MELRDLQILLDYHYWARDRMLAAVDPLTPDQLNRDLGSSFKSVRETIVHIYAAEWAWCSRWNGQTPTAFPPVDTFPDITTIRAKWSTMESEVRAVLDRMGHEGVDTVMEYRLLSGEPRRSVFWHMLQHVVNHASYHRGQVTTMLRQLGAKPPESLDLITFYRTRG
jgi:uncharacterized damage-inducible protein DinB